MANHRLANKTSKSPFYEFVRTISPGGMVAKDGWNIVLHHPFPCNNIDELEAEEYRVLNEFNARGEPCYNDKIDGKPSDETKEKISKSRIGHIVSDETKVKMSKAKMGHIVSDETKKKLSGENNYGFNYGSVSLSKNGKYNYWRFSYNVNGKQIQGKSHSINKLGAIKAKEKAMQDRRDTYPEYIPSKADNLEHQEYIVEHSD